MDYTVDPAMGVTPPQAQVPQVPTGNGNAMRQIGIALLARQNPQLAQILQMVGQRQPQAQQGLTAPPQIPFQGAPVQYI